MINQAGQLHTAVTRDGLPRTAVTNGDGQDETETRAGSTRSDTNLKLIDKIYLEGLLKTPLLFLIFIDEKGVQREAEKIN